MRPGSGFMVQDVVGCNLDRSCGYQIFDGIRRPARDFSLRLVLLHLSEEETQRLLQQLFRQPFLIQT